MKRQVIEVSLCRLSGSFGLEIADNCEVLAVPEAGAAVDSGIQPGSTVIAINGTPTKDRAEVLAILSGLDTAVFQLKLPS